MISDMLSMGRLGLCICDIYMLDHFFQSMFEKRITKRTSIAYIITAAVVIWLENAFGNTFLNLLFIPFLFVTFCKISFDLSMGNCIVYALIYFIVFSGGREVVFELLFRVFSGIFCVQIPEWFTPGGMPYLIMEYILAFALLHLIENYTGKLEVHKKGNANWYLLVLPLSSLVILFGYLYIDLPISDPMGIIMCLGAVSLYISNAVIFIILGKFAEMQERVQRLQMAELKQHLDKINYESIDKANRIYRKYLHDMHKYFNQFRILAGRGENNIIVEIVDELEGKLKLEEESVIHTKDTVLNVLLTEYSGRAKEKDIRMDIHIDVLQSLDFISNTDKISMFGNMLQNALEAAQKCIGNDRYIEIKLYMGNRFFLILQVENGVADQPIQNGERYLTTKEDKANHGIGISVVEELAEKYGGTLNLENGDHRFTAILMLSVCGKNIEGQNRNF